MTKNLNNGAIAANEGGGAPLKLLQVAVCLCPYTLFCPSIKINGIKIQPHEKALSLLLCEADSAGMISIFEVYGYCFVGLEGVVELHRLLRAENALLLSISPLHLPGMTLEIGAG